MKKKIDFVEMAKQHPFCGCMHAAAILTAPVLAISADQPNFHSLFFFDLIMLMIIEFAKQIVDAKIVG